MGLLIVFQLIMMSKSSVSWRFFQGSEPTMRYNARMLCLKSVFKSPNESHEDIDPERALRTIRVLGVSNLLLILALAGSLWWASRGADALRMQVSSTDDQPVRVLMEARMASGGRAVRNGDTVSDPVLTIHGVLADYGRLREGLDGLALTVRGTRVDVVPETGEFTERVVLSPGSNQINFGIWWDGREWQRQHVEVIFIKNTDPDDAAPAAL